MIPLAWFVKRPDIPDIIKSPVQVSLDTSRQNTAGHKAPRKSWIAIPMNAGRQQMTRRTYRTNEDSWAQVDNPNRRHAEVARSAALAGGGGPPAAGAIEDVADRLAGFNSHTISERTTLTISEVTIGK
jgi:hypothetical protein